MAVVIVINNFYAKLCVPDVLKNMNIKVFNQISRTNKARYVSWNKTCKCKCILDTSICNTKRRCNNDKCGCAGKELIGKRRCDNGFVKNPNRCECECDKSCNLAEGCSQNIDGHEVIYNTTLNDYKRVFLYNIHSTIYTDAYTGFKTGALIY